MNKCLRHSLLQAEHCPGLPRGLLGMQAGQEYSQDLEAAWADPCDFRGSSMPCKK